MLVLVTVPVLQKYPYSTSYLFAIFSTLLKSTLIGYLVTSIAILYLLHVFQKSSPSVGNRIPFVRIISRVFGKCSLDTLKNSIKSGCNNGSPPIK